MNQLYTLVQAIINNGSSDALNGLILTLNQNPGEQSKQFGCGQNLFYVLRRLVGSSLARDPRIKQNSSNALIKVRQQVPNISTLNKSTFGQFFIDSSDLKDVKTKQEIAAYIQGKINVIHALSQCFKNNDKVIAHFVDLCNKNQNCQQQLIEALYVLAGPKVSSLKLTVTQVNSTFLMKILTNKTLSQENIGVILTEAIESYPKQSVTLKHLGLNLQRILDSPQEFFRKHYSEFINVTEEQTEDGDLKRLFYLLAVQKYFLSHVQITKANLDKFLCIQMIIAWLEQLRVKNKHMKKLANSVQIHFDKDPDFNFEVLKLLHDKQIYLENISANHPFAELYANVEPTRLWQYLVELTQNQQQQQQIDDQQKTPKKQQYLSELEYITRQRLESFTPIQLGQTITILIKAYQQSKKSQKLLNLVWSLFHHLNVQNDKTKKNKKKIVLDSKSPLVLSKVKLNQLELQAQIQQVIYKVIKFLRAKVKSSKQSTSKISITFLNFITSLAIYSIVYPQQSDVCAQIQFISKDLQLFLAQQQALEEGKDLLKKKRKKSQQAQDPKKPIHVLIDVFISLLTKAPMFLRTAINLLFEQLVPYLQTSDLDTLLDVIQKPDQEYIEEI